MFLTIGDVVIFHGSIGHTGIIREVTPTGEIHMFHAQGDDSGQALRSSTIMPTQLNKFLETADVFTPPWHSLTSAPGFSQQQLQMKLMSVAYTLFHNRVPFGKYDAIRLFIGNSGMGKSARARITTYRQRFEQSPLMLHKCHGDLVVKLGQFVSAVTCVSTALLCYHLTFNESHGVFFPNLDPEHTMPNTLREWMKKNWRFVSPKSPLHAPIAWRPDDTMSVCRGCALSFRLFLRRHHCRGCGQIFCNTCAPLRPGIEASVRYCRRCVP